MIHEREDCLEEFWVERWERAHRLILELGEIMRVPTAPAGVNGLYRYEDFIERAKILVREQRR